MRAPAGTCVRCDQAASEGSGNDLVRSTPFPATRPRWQRVGAVAAFEQADRATIRERVPRRLPVCRSNRTTRAGAKPRRSIGALTDRAANHARRSTARCRHGPARHDRNPSAAGERVSGLAMRTMPPHGEWTAVARGRAAMNDAASLARATWRRRFRHRQLRGRQIVAQDLARKTTREAPDTRMLHCGASIRMRR